jgi:gliding motility-associated-like protein
LWNGVNRPAAGTYTFTTTNSQGCDSIATLNLTVKSSSTSNVNIAVCPSELPFLWNGVNRTAAGTYTFTTTNSQGCDSIATLNLTVKSTSTSNVNIAVCPSELPYLWNGINRTTAGTYTYTTTNAQGCDSTATLNLTVRTNTSSTTDVSICPSELPYSWNGSRPIAGTYTFTTTNAQGCDSVATLNLIVKANTTSTTDVSICPSELPYLWNGINRTTAGTYTYTTTNAQGCDSVATLNLTVKTNTTSISDVSICPSQLPYSWNGSRPTAGTYTFTTTNAQGCDSVATLNLTVKANTSSTTDVSICPSQLPYSWNGSRPTAGTYTYTTTNAQGCDSTATLNLTVRTNTSSTTDVSICPSQLPYSWNGSRPTAGTYTYTTTNAQGCDSIATLNLTVKTNTTSISDVSICPSELPYLWNGINRPTAGTYTFTTTNAQGCDSVATLNLTVKTNTSSISDVSICPSELPYLWNGINRTTAGTYTFTTTNAQGCDSVATLNLTVKANTSSISDVSICPSELPYLWNGVNRTAAGTYTFTTTNSQGCDSIATLNLTLRTNTSSISDVSICPSELPYLWNGVNRPAAGTYTFTTTNSQGCDSIATLNLTVKTNTTSISDVSICPSELPYLWNGINRPTAGTYTFTTTNAQGCDSVATLNLTVKTNTSSISDVSICPSELPYLWNGINRTTAGTYTFTTTNAQGCDSVATLNLTVKANTSSISDVSICPSELPYLWNGINRTTAGTYTYTTTNAQGCDSTATLNLTVKTNTTSISDVSICPSELPYLWNGINRPTAGTYTFTTTNAQGCDSIATLNLTVKSTSTSNVNIAVCPSELPYLWNGVNRTTAGTYTFTTTNAQGCDSVATLNLTVKANTSSISDVSICPSELPYLWNGVNRPAAGTYTFTTTNSQGCDSIATLNLTVKTNTTSISDVSICPSELPYLWNGINRPTAGTYTFTTTNAQGCDSIATLNLTVKANTSPISDVSICPSQLPYSWNGSRPTAGTYTYTTTNAQGCDSIATLNLTVKSTSTSNVNIAVCPSELPYLWNGVNRTAAGTYTFTTTNSQGCDSIATLNLTLRTNTTSTTDVSICPSELPYLWNGVNRPAAGTYTFTTTNSQGCDSIATLNLTVKTNTTSTTDVSICPSELPYLWNGINRTTAGTYTYTTTNAQGCDSVATLNLTVKTNTTSISDVSICPSQLPYSWNGSRPTAGTYTYTTANAQGCDSIATLNLTVKANTTSTTDVSICPSQLPYSWNGSRPTAGTYTFTTTNSEGCDSIATLNLTVKANTTSTTDVSICPSQLPYSWNGITRPAAGTYTFTTTNSQGCDSIATLNLTVKTNTTSISDVSICPSELPYLWNGINRPTAGTYTFTTTNAQGCDSIATLNLTVKTNTTSISDVSICPSQLPYSWNGSRPTAGTYTFTTTNAQGCDSIATLNLTVKTNTTSISDVSICPSELPYSWNGSRPTAGTYTYTTTNAQGCDSTATLNLTVRTNTSSTTDVSICPSQLPYSWNGSRPTAGTYTYTTTNAQGCDSTATLNLTVRTNTSSTTDVSICPSQLPYSWNGSRPTAGTYTYTTTNAQGCDSIATLNLTVKSTSTSNVNIAVCPSELPYLWNGVNRPAAGTYTFTTTNSQGCDSIATLNLTVKSSSTSNVNIAVCPSELPFLWNGVNRTAAGTYTFTTTNSQGCDSIATLNLTVKANTSSISDVSICPSELPYLWNGVNRPAAGTYTFTTTNSQGCDSVATLNLTVKANTSSTTDVSICPSELPYSWNGSRPIAGTYTFTTTNAQGCDSVATLNLIVKANTTSISDVSICPSELPYLWNGVNRPAAGTYTFTTTNSQGCDSIATLNLTVKSSSTSNVNIAVCPSELPFLWNGVNRTAAGTYTFTTTNSQGCDSIATLNLTVKTNTTSISDVSICPSQLPYSWNGSRPTAGTYTFTTTNAQGCDSIATLNLTVKTNTTSISDVSICPSELPYSWNGSRPIAGTYTFTTTNAQGCDSVATLNLIVKANTTSTTDVSICPSELPYLWNGINRTTAGTYTYTTTNAQGCDSIATLNLTITQNTTSTANVRTCNNYTWNGVTYTLSGTYTYKTTNSNGCDSLATLILQISTPSSSTTNYTSCDNYTWNGSTYTQSGVYTFKTVNNIGCDSIATLILRINPLPIVDMPDSLFVVQGQSVVLNNEAKYASNFKWSPAIYLNSDSLQKPISQPFTSLQYRLIANSLFGCTSATKTVYVKVITTDNIPNAFSPNGDGINDYWDLRKYQDIKGANVSVFTRDGRVVYKSRNLGNMWDGRFNSQKLPTGVYYYLLELGSVKQLSGYLTILK